jgi:hypothetical protein
VFSVVSHAIEVERVIYMASQSKYSLQTPIHKNGPILSYFTVGPYLADNFNDSAIVKSVVREELPYCHAQGESVVFPTQHRIFDAVDRPSELVDLRWLNS